MDSLQTVIEDIVSPPDQLNISNLEYFDVAVDGIPPNTMRDVIEATKYEFRDTINQAIQRVWRRDLQIIYVSIIILNILFLASAIAGINSEWYQNLEQHDVNPYIIGALWVVAAIFSYGSIFMLWQDVQPEEKARDVRISVYFLIGTFLTVLWAGVFFQGNNLVASAWFAALMFIYQVWLLIHIWYTNAVAGLFMLPIVIMYGYFFYEAIHVAAINGQPV